MSENTPQRTWIKICGITREVDARRCVIEGIDALGLVFTERSPRHISPEQGRRLRDLVSGKCTTVALFMDQDRLSVERVIDAVKPDMLQFHGQEPAGFCSQFQLPYIKALSFSEPALNSLVEQHHQAAALIIDSHQPGEIGGTGNVFDWQELTTTGSASWIIAGGLDPDNVGLAISQCHPWGVDVSSGVESSRGIKDAGKIAAFARAVERADEAT